jgi:hypothetical protein
MTKIILLLILLAGGGLTALRRRHGQWSQYLSSLVEQVVREASPLDRTADLAETHGLPEPVRRYFHQALRDGLPLISQTYLVQKGGFRTKPEVEGWAKLSARQAFSSAPRAFVWDAKIAMAPSVSVRVCDAYHNGTGTMRAALFSMIRLADIGGSREINQGALMRYLAEAVWFPTALLPSQGVAWEAMDENRARATITDAGNTVSLEFSFNDDGEIVSVYSPGRYREVDGAYIPTAWEGRFADYTDINGYRVPIEAEAAWHLPEVVFPYWRAMIIETHYR